MNEGRTERICKFDRVWRLRSCALGLTAGMACADEGGGDGSQGAKLQAVLDPMMEQAVADGNMPGGVLLIGHNGQVVYRKAFGMRSLEPTREPMTVDTIFDMASLTKCVATTMSMMQLIEEGRCG